MTDDYLLGAGAAKQPFADMRVCPSSALGGHWEPRLSAMTRRSPVVPRFPLSSSSQRQAEIAVAMDVRWRHLRRRPSSNCRGVVAGVGSVRIRLGDLKEQAFKTEFAPSVLGVISGAIAQQPLAPSAVGGRDAHRAIDREAAAVLPLRHRLRAIAWQ